MQSIIALLLLASSVQGFVSPSVSRAATLLHETASDVKGKEGGMSGDLGIPCDDECALSCYPNLPESVHPGVLSGQAQLDLLQHAKENGTFVSKFLVERK